MHSEACNRLEILTIDEDAKSLGIFVAYTYAWLEERKSFTQYPLEEEIKNLIDYLKNKYTLEKLKEDLDTQQCPQL